MSDKTTANPILTFFLGALIIVCAGLGYAAYTGSLPWQEGSDVRIELPGGAAIEGSVEGG